MQPRLAHPIPFALPGDHLAGEQAGDDVDRVGHAVALGFGIDAEHHRVRRQQAWTEAEHRPTTGLVVELDDAVGHHEGVVIGQRDDPSAKADVLRALRGGGDEQFWLAVDLVAAGMMFADPRFGVIVHIQPLHQLEVALHA
jgi:hypothetical protein